MLYEFYNSPGENKGKPFKIESLSSKDIVGITCGKVDGYAWSGNSCNLLNRSYPFRASAERDITICLCDLVEKLSGTSGSDGSDAVYFAQAAVLGILSVHFEALSSLGAEDAARIGFAEQFHSVKLLLLAWSAPGNLIVTAKDAVASFDNKSPVPVRDGDMDDPVLVRAIAARKALFSGWYMLQPTHMERQAVSVHYKWYIYMKNR